MPLKTDYTPPAAVNPYTGAVDTLLAAGPEAAWDIDVDTTKATTDDEKTAAIAKAIRNFQDAARAVDRSARVTERIENATGPNITFVLVPKITKKTKAEKEAEAAELSEEVPVSA